MEEKYWNDFMASGAVADYLNYRGIAICESVMQRYRDSADSETKGAFHEPDNGNGNGTFCRSNGGI